MPGSNGGRGAGNTNETSLSMSLSLLEMKKEHIGVDCTMSEIFHNKKFFNEINYYTMSYMTMIFC